MKCESLELKKVKIEEFEKFIDLAKEFIKFNISSHPMYAKADINKTYEGNAKWYKELINQNSELYFIVYKELKVGYMLLEQEYPDDAETYNPGKIGTIDELFILSDYRYMGLGQKSISKAEKLLKDAECSVIRIAHFDWNSAGDLYKKLGYKNFSHRLEKKIGSDMNAM